MGSTACFNPRTHVGCDLRIVRKIGLFASFNPRTHVGCDPAAHPSPNRTQWFQSTHPRRVRRCFSGFLLFSLRFQSTHPRRVRPFALHCFDKGRKFQSTHPRRVRQISALRSAIALQFQSTHPRRVRHVKQCTQVLKLRFNPRTHVGCDYQYHSVQYPIEVSIHAPT